MKKSIYRIGLILAALCLQAAVCVAKEPGKLSFGLRSNNDALQIARNGWNLLHEQRDKDVQKIIEKYNKIIAKGKSEAPVAKLYLSDLYWLSSPPYMQNPEESLRLLNEASRELTDEYPDAKNLATYMKGYNYYKGYGVQQNLDSALYYLQEAALADDKLAGGLGKMYLYGDGVEQDIPKSIVLFDNMVKTGNETGYALLAAAQMIDDQMNEGTLNREAFELWRQGGFVYDQDPEKAFGLYKQAADMGFAPAQFEVGSYYLNNQVYPCMSDGERNPQSYEMGIPYLEKAGEAGFDPAYNNLGTFLEFREAKRKLGMIVARHPVYEAQAYGYWKIAADHGFPQSQVAVGIFHMYGYGPAEKNYEVAYQYFAAASQQGLERGKFFLKELNNVVDRERRQALDQSIRNFNNALMGFGNSLSRVINRPRKTVTATAKQETADSQEDSETTKENGVRKHSSADVNNLRIAYNTARRRLENYKSGYWTGSERDIKEAQQSMREIRQHLESSGQWKWGTHAMETWNGVVD